MLAEPLQLAGGRLRVLSAPGLGILGDGDKVEFYARQYEAQGQYYNFPIPERS